MTKEPDIGDIVTRLVDGGVIRENDDGSLATTDAFEAVRAEYAETYRSADGETFVGAVAEAFGLAPETAEAQIEANGVTRAQLAAYLAVESYLDASPTAETKAVMAHLVSEVSPPPSVPEEIPYLDDDSYEAFLDANPDAVLTVWKRHCDPCERLKSDLPDLLDALPEHVAVGGLDGESASSFRLAHAVNSAPVVLWFRDGERVETRDGYVSPSAFAAVARDVY